MVDRERGGKSERDGATGEGKERALGAGNGKREEGETEEARTLSQTVNYKQGGTWPLLALCCL